MGGGVGLMMPGSPTPTYVDFEKFKDECTNTDGAIRFTG